MAKSQAEKWGGWDLNQIFCFSTWPHTALGALEGYILHTHVVCVYNVCIGCVYRGVCRVCVQGCVQRCVCRGVCTGVCVEGVCAGGVYAGVCVQVRVCRGVCAGCV